MGGMLVGVSDLRIIGSTHGEINFFEGIDAEIFEADVGETHGYLLCIVSEDVLPLVEDGIVFVTITMGRGINTTDWNIPFKVAGTVALAEDGVSTVFGLYSFISRFQPFSDGLSRASVLVDGREVLMDVRRLRATISETRDSIIWPLIGITRIEAHDALASADGVEISFFDGFDESMFEADENVCIVSEDVLPWVTDGILTVETLSRTGAGAELIAAELVVAGTVSGKEDSVVFAPFLTVSGLGVESDGQRPHTERIRAVIADNRDLVEFKQSAMRTFMEVGVFFNIRTFSMTIFDGEFYDITESLMQTIFFIDVATPFVYLIAICVGFVTSFLLTRRRKAEFAILRSVGVNKFKLFLGTAFEQAVLCAAGVAIGCALFTLTWGYVFIERPAVFLACYIAGAMICAVRAARTDVMSMLKSGE